MSMFAESKSDRAMPRIAVAPKIDANLLRGDCLRVLPTLPDDSVDMVFSDLPYAHVGADGKTRKVTANKWDTPIDLAALWEQLRRVGTERCAFIFTATQPFATTLINSWAKGFRYDLVWRKGQAVGHLNARRAPLRVHENVLLFCRVASTYNPQMWNAHKPSHNPRGALRDAQNFSANYGAQRISEIRHACDRFPLSVVDIRSVQKSLHPTQKPVALLDWLIKTYSNPGDTVLDPTFGSCTTGVSCVQNGRNFIGIEKDAKYFAVGQKRLKEAIA